jgi:hypothetical protein
MSTLRGEPRRERFAAWMHENDVDCVWWSAR